LKKVLVLFGIMLLCATGCGSKTLSCSMSESDDEKNSLSYEIKINYNGENVESGQATFVGIVSDEYSQDEIREIAKEYLEGCKDEGLTNCESDIQSGKFMVRGYGVKGEFEDNFDIDDLSSSKSYEENKKALEDAGFTCK